ncbi:MAG: FAD-dependent oxidoreductase [Helicobacteraceae bacterium]|jgi:thioredoxin reductase (NADPH)|nr:FAD-dependent oxidoreductase [Helicobacteraceae bacterium]
MIDIAIIGGGPAGLTAGLYAARGGIKNVLLFENGMHGGQITASSEIENYPGQIDVVSGMELTRNWFAQGEKFGLKSEFDGVAKVRKTGDFFTIATENGKTHEARAVIFATGSVPMRAGFADEEKFIGRGISTCATCDGFFYRNKDVIVIGGGNAALEEAYYLAKSSGKVYIVHRREEFRAPPATVERVKNTPNIELVLNAKPIACVGDEKGVTGLKVSQNGTERVIEAPGIFLFVGRTAKSEALKTDDNKYICEANDRGEIIVDLRMRTSLAGLFAAGDVRAEAPRQVVCAAGDGATAALSAISYLDEHPITEIR